jgi:signal transduction histidine kinase
LERPAQSFPKSFLLTAAFAALLLLLGASAVAAWRNAKLAQDRVAALHQLHLDAGASLSAIRANVFLNAILTRDYLLDPDPAHSEQYVQQFADIRRKTEDSLKALETFGPDPERKTALDHLRTEINSYWDPTELALDWSPDEKRARGTAMLRQRLRRREEVFALAAQVEALMEGNFLRERQRITSTDREFRKSLAWTTAVVLLFGLGIAGAALARMLALEKRSEYAAFQLRQLSGQLRSAQEKERKSLSRELHDQVGQMLTGLRMELAGMGRLLADSQSELSLRIARAKGTVEQTLGIVRNIAMLLRPSMLDDLGLTPALSWLVKDVSKASGIEIRADVDPAADLLSDALRTCVYRVIQEALTNACRHSGARTIAVTLGSSGGWVVGRILDDGRGFDTSVRRSGLGLLGTEERVKELGGTVLVVSSPGSGTTIEFRLPNPEPTENPNDQNLDSGRSRDRSNRVEASTG